MKIANSRKAALMAALPYIKPKYQKQIAAALKFMELRDFLQFYNSLGIQNNQRGNNMNNQRTMEILGEENAALFAEFLDKIRGKGIYELPPILMEFKARLPKDKEFTAAEKNIIIEETLAGLPEDEKNQYKSMMKILKIM
ncbi:MAG: hypothetical protein LBE35_05820 [Clostridiales bacterium]|jgi:hypothetical protein|nr:hypothetical protein [Clostridiales bacterium]